MVQQLNWQARFFNIPNETLVWQFWSCLQGGESQVKKVTLPSTNVHPSIQWVLFCRFSWFCGLDVRKKRHFDTGDRSVPSCRRSISIVADHFDDYALKKQDFIGSHDEIQKVLALIPDEGRTTAGFAMTPASQNTWKLECLCFGAKFRRSEMGDSLFSRIQRSAAKCRFSKGWEQSATMADSQKTCGRLAKKGKTATFEKLQMLRLAKEDPEILVSYPIRSVKKREKFNCIIPFCIDVKWSESEHEMNEPERSQKKNEWT